jgi:hypothetical protein
MEHYTSDGVVFTLHYTVSANDGTYSSSAYGSVGLEKPEPGNMIPYADLTEEFVVGWVKDHFGPKRLVKSKPRSSSNSISNMHPPPLPVCHGLADCRWSITARHRHRRHDGVAVVPYL